MSCICGHEMYQHSPFDDHHCWICNCKAHKSAPTEGGTDGTSEGSLAATAARSLGASVHSSPPFSGRAESVLSQTNGAR